MRYWIVVALAMVACKPREMKYHKVDLPGFSAEVPRFVEPKPGLNYRDDDIEFRDGLYAVSMSWDETEILTVEELPKAVQTVMEELVKDEKTVLEPAFAMTIGGQKASRVDGKISILDMTFVDVACGKRSVTIQIIGPRIEEIRDRLFRTFECKPDAAEEKQLAAGPRIPIGTDDPATLAGFRYTDEDRSVFAITNDELIAVFDTTGTADNLEVVRKVMPKLLGISADFTPDPNGRETRTLPGGKRRMFDRGSMTVEGATLAAVTSLWSCDGDDAVLALVLIVESSDPSKVMDWLMKIRCAKPGDVPPAIAPHTDDAEPEPEASPATTKQAPGKPKQPIKRTLPPPKQ